MKIPRIVYAVLLVSVAGLSVCMAGAPKVIIDTDYNTIGDDGQVGAMASQLYGQGVIDLLGFTIVSGNQWRDQEVVDCLKAVERMGVEHRVKVYAGSQYPLVHDYKAYLYEALQFNGSDYLGAYSAPQPSPSQLVAPPDGFATHTKPARKDAVDFIIESVHRYPHEVSLLTIGPLTNVAIAMRKDPTIVPLIKQIVYMGGQVDVIGNAFNDAGEFNWWFDSEAAKVVLRSSVPQTVVPLDVTNTVPLTKDVYDRITHDPSKQTIVTKLYANNFSSFFGSGPAPYVPYIYDTIALACFVDPSFATDVRERYIDIDTNSTATYGKAKGYLSNLPTNLLQKQRVVYHIDQTRFLNFYVDLLTRPVPVRFSNESDENEDNE
jgi:inosine-uridine nucleoside N-ribohydrolase